MDAMELERWLALIHARRPCLRDLDRLSRTRFPDKRLMELAPEELFALLDHSLAGLPRPDRRALAADREWLEGAPGRCLLPITDPRYPWMLREIPDPPLGLFVHGDPRILNQPCLSIVGSRNPTPQGRETATRFGGRLAAMGFTVVSGMARGIDGCAHRGALETGATVGVCAHGLDTVYPEAHQALAEQMVRECAVVSEFPTGARPQKHHFPQRNRVISGMSLGTLVVEAGLKSGSLITAYLAADQSREVFAVPGPIQSPQSKGCHSLIRNGAILTESVDDILQEIGGCPSQGPAARDDAGGPDIHEAHARFLEHMGYAPCSTDELVKRSGLTAAEVSSMLLVLELEGCVELCPGGTYVRVTRS